MKHAGITSLLKNRKLQFCVYFKPGLFIMYKFIFPKAFLLDYSFMYFTAHILSWSIFIFVLISLLSTFQKNTNNQTSHFTKVGLF